MLAAMAIGIGSVAAQEVVSPCPEVKILQKPDNMNDPYYHQNQSYVTRGWDTAVTCAIHQLELSAEPYIPVQFFNGTYTVEEIPYNPPDTTFYLGGLGTRMDINSDDVFAPAATNIAFPFYFFGIRKSYFRLGDNGLVTFTTSYMSQSPGGSTPSGNHCPYSYSSGIPWHPTNNSGNPTPESEFHRMHDAIYGVYEDTYPQPSTVTYPQGIYYGVLDNYPCRKIIASWNQIPLFGNTPERQTYQIVCYEGSNIIEVHVKRRGCCSSTTGGRGTIGIQNATGLPQVQGELGTSNAYVTPNSPASFPAPGWNPRQVGSGVTANEVAFRFTPQGNTQKTYYWYRIYDDGRPNDTLTQNTTDTNGWYEPMGSDPDHPTLTKAHVAPTCNARYVLSLNFKNADTTWYRLKDTITIGYDHENDMQLKHPAEPDSSRRHDVCQGQNATVSLIFNPLLTPKTKTWTVSRILNGTEITLPQSMYTIAPDQMSLTLRPDPQSDTLPRNKIDSVRIQAFVEFTNSCTNFDTFLIRTFPNFDTVDKRGICQGETFTWSLNHQTYTQSTTSPQVTLQSEPGCDSVVHLDLTVSSTSLTIDTIVDCKPVYWKGKWYYTSNTATAAGDTVVEKNQWDCDSVVRLNLSIYPLTAKLTSSVDHFDMNNLDVVLTDISIGGDSRRWILPTGPEQTSEVAYYTIPANYNEADILMIAHSPYGCLDTAEIIIPLNKEFFWVPNAFTPDNPAGNELFGSVSVGTLTQEMYIYNRWGEQVYYCSGVDCTWDGHDTHGRACPQGAYVYIIRYTNIFDPKETKIVKGAVTLIR